MFEPNKTNQIKTTNTKSKQTKQSQTPSGRPVTALSWSPKYPELLLASYASQDDPLSFDPDGTVICPSVVPTSRQRDVDVTLT